MPSSVIELEVNGAEEEFVAKPGTTLLSVLRDTLGLTAAKRGCGVGTCGTCTCLLDGDAVMSCLVPVETINGSTREDARGRRRRPTARSRRIQQAFLDGFATQCGFCTPGMIMAAEALLAENPTPTREDVVRAISGNVCRCTGYESIIRAILDAADRINSMSATTTASTSSARPSSARTRWATSPAARSTSRTSTRPGCCTCGCTAPSATTRRSSTSTPSAAEQVKGVVKVLTHADVPNNWYTVLKLINVGYDDEPVLAEGKVMYRGEPIVAVVATTERAAREGAAAVKVTYEDLPHVLDVEEAIKPETPVIKPHGHNHFIYEGYKCRRVRFGDVEQGFAEADHIFEWDYQSRPIEQAPTETTGCIVIPQHDGRLKIHSDTQAASSRSTTPR